MQQSFDDPFAEETLDLQKIIKKYLHLWPWFLLSLVIALGIAWLSNAFKHNVYQNSLTLLIFEEEPLLKLDENVAAAFQQGAGTRIQNEIGILTSRSMINKTAGDLDFEIEYFQRGSFIDTELYPNPYFTIEPDSVWPQPVNVPIIASRNTDGTWTLTLKWESAALYSFANHEIVGNAQSNDQALTVSAGEWVENTNYRFRILESNTNLPDPGQEYLIFFRDLNTITSRYRGLIAEEIKTSTLLRLSIQGSNRNKNAAFLNQHANNFLQRELDKKNFRAQKTIDFINEQLILVAQSLNTSETNLENFRETGQILNLDIQTQQSFNRLETIQQEITRLTVKEKYYQYLSNYLDQVGENGSDLVAPSSLGVDDPLLSGLIVELMNLYTERQEFMINARRDNPYLTNLNSRIEITKNTMKESLRNIVEANKLSITDLDERLAILKEEISTIPESQRNLFNIERQFNIHDELYTFMQSKKSEIEITMAGFMPVHEIIDNAKASEAQLISPRKRMTWYIAIFGGLMFPVLVIFLYEFFNDKVRSSEDIEKITSYPILGYISNNGLKDGYLLSFDKPSLQAESFRSLRTNAQFILPHNETPVVLITSTLLGEGKTFVSLNIAAGYATMGKKTILLSMDLRKPKLNQYLQSNENSGISTYLSSSLNPDDIIKKGPVDNLDIAFSGQIPPNPAELLNSPKMEKLFHFLKENYEIILIDTPPVGMVADALLLIKYCNAIIYLVRHNKTPIKHLQATLRNMKEKDIRNINIVFNDIPRPGKMGYYNAYGYQYGYFEKTYEQST